MYCFKVAKWLGGEAASLLLQDLKVLCLILSAMKSHLVPGLPNSILSLSSSLLPLYPFSSSRSWSHFPLQLS